MWVIQFIREDKQFTWVELEPEHVEEIEGYTLGFARVGTSYYGWDLASGAEVTRFCTIFGYDTLLQAVIACKRNLMMWKNILPEVFNTELLRAKAGMRPDSPTPPASMMPLQFDIVNKMPAWVNAEVERREQGIFPSYDKVASRLKKLKRFNYLKYLLWTRK